MSIRRLQKQKTIDNQLAMSNLCKRLSKRKKPTVKQRVNKMREACKFYTSFNIFTRDGQNLTVTPQRQMTLYEAQYHYKALSISGNE